MKKLDRRTVLRGAGGITLGLPFLELMGAGRSSGKPPVRVAYLFLGNGIGPHEIWNPKKQGKNFDLHTTLTPLKPVGNLINVHTGLNAKLATVHNRSTAGLLAGKNLKRGSTTSGTTIDQIIAQTIGTDSYLPSLELSIDKSKHEVDVDGSNASLGGHISWSSPSTPIPREVNPKSAFKRLFKGMEAGGTDPLITKSVLDYVREDARRLQNVLGKEDSHKLDHYFHSIREIERRVAKMDQVPKLPSGTKAPDEGLGRTEKINAMIDIMILAFQTNRTKVASLMFTNDGGTPARYKMIGVSGNHHRHTHHGNDPAKVAALTKIVKYYIGFYSRMIQKMSTINEANGTLLDNSLLLFTSNFKSGHGREDMPCIIAGKGGGSVDTGRHIRHKNKDYNSMLLGMAKTAGCNRLSKFATTNTAII